MESSAAAEKSTAVEKKDKIRRFDAHETEHMKSLDGLPLASFGQRLAAYVIDISVVLVFWTPFVVLKAYLQYRGKPPENLVVKFDPREIEDLLWVVAYVGFSLWLFNGLTIGKRLLRIRVVSLKGTKITLWQGIERALGYGASALEGGFGFIQFFINPNRQCVHDRIAETIVVRERVPAPAPPVEADPEEAATPSATH